MVTTFKREDLQKILDKEIGFYNEISLVCDKLRVIYNVLAWSHMTKDFFEVDTLVEGLTENCFKDLNDNPDKQDASRSSAGVKVEAWIDGDGFVNVDYYFVLI